MAALNVAAAEPVGWDFKPTEAEKAISLYKKAHGTKVATEEALSGSDRKKGRCWFSKHQGVKEAISLRNVRCSMD